MRLDFFVRRFVPLFVALASVTLPAQRAFGLSCVESIRHLVQSSATVASLINSKREVLRLMQNFGLSSVDYLSFILAPGSGFYDNALTVAMVGRNFACQNASALIPSTILEYTLRNGGTSVSMAMDVHKSFRNMGIGRLLFAEMLLRNPRVTATTEVLIDTNLAVFMSQMIGGGNQYVDAYEHDTPTQISLNTSLVNGFQAIRQADPTDDNTVLEVEGFRLRLLAAFAASPQGAITSRFNFRPQMLEVTLPAAPYTNMPVTYIRTELNVSAEPRVFVVEGGVSYLLTVDGHIERQP